MTTEPNWDDPEYRAATTARVDAYIAFNAAAEANPYKPWQDGFQPYYDRHVIPARDAFVAANEAWQAHAARVADHAG